MRRTVTTWLAVLATACGGTQMEETAPETAREQSALTAENGRRLNGAELNGRRLNGRRLNGRDLDGTRLSTASLGGGGLTRLWLEGSELVAETADGGQVRGSSLVGAELSEEGLEDALRFRVDAVERHGDVWRYSVSYQADGKRWEPLCAESKGESYPVIPLRGWWNEESGVPGGGAHLEAPGVLTFACTQAALGKCVELGYAPWRTAPRCDADGTCEEVSLAAHHQACTRMMRADYCGDGRSFTRDGTLINVYDGLGIEVDTESWPLEAEWDADGARCLERRRIPGSERLPRCERELEQPECGAPAHFADGTLLMTEAPPSSSRK